MQQPNPLISCICITNNRPHLLQKAINCFTSQNYVNKELVISFPRDDWETKNIINDPHNNEVCIYAIERDETDSLGNARNQAIKKCHGDYICIWDDDDWYHPSRISYQYNSIRNKGEGYQASILSRILLFDHTTGEAYYSFPYTWEGTILCRKVILLQNQYSNSNKGEDSHVIRFLSSKKQLLNIEDAPFLYIYIYHGKNTWEYKHFEFFLSKSEHLKGKDKDQVFQYLNS